MPVRLLLICVLGAAGCAASPVVVIPPEEPDSIPPAVRVAWERAAAIFERHDREGFDAAACEETIAAFEAADEEQGGLLRARFMIGVVHHRCGDRAEARRGYEAVLAAEPRFCPARSALGLVALESGDEPGAVAAFERAIRDDSRCTEAYVNLASIERRRGQHGPALANLRRALAFRSDYLPAFVQLALLHLDLAAAAGEDGERHLDLAEVICRQAQLVDRDFAPIYNAWGVAKVRRGQITEAIRMFERASELDPRMVEPLLNFGELTLSFRGYEDARRAFGRAVELAPSSYDARIGLGAAERGLRRFEEAERAYDRARAIDDARPEAWFNLGVLYHNYVSAGATDPEPALRRALGFYDAFVERARGRAAFAGSVEDVLRVCPPRRRDCRPGRRELIRQTLDDLAEVRRMQAAR
jgi:tetratricopeptide (TPR) repeat protein